MSASSGGSGGARRGLLIKNGVGWSPDKFEKQRRHYSFQNKKSGIRLMDVESDEGEGDEGGESDDSSDEELCSRARMKEMSRQLAGGNGRGMEKGGMGKEGGGEGGRKKVGGVGGATTTFNDKAGMQLGFDLRGSLANITTWIDKSDSEEGEEEQQQVEKERRRAKGVVMSKERLVQTVKDVVVGDDDVGDADGELEEDNIPYERGPANDMTDKELIVLLKQQPKDVPVMRTRESFRRFFARMKRDRMEYILRAANAEKKSGQADKKVAKRMALMEDCLV